MEYRMSSLLKFMTVTSVNAAYVIDEVKSILKDTDLGNYKTSKETMGLTIVGVKADSNYKYYG